MQVATLESFYFYKRFQFYLAASPVTWYTHSPNLGFIVSAFNLPFSAVPEIFDSQLPKIYASHFALPSLKKG
jgi:hypothetical protein